jgi:predicted HicB family RNase H-like nuclease
MFKYKGFVGKVAIDEDEKMLVGYVINLAKDGIDFSGKTVEEAEEDFRGAVNDYLSWAEEDGFEPEKPYQGNILVRATPELHREADIASTDLGISLNAFVIDALVDKLERLGSEEQVLDDEMYAIAELDSSQQVIVCWPPERWTYHFPPIHEQWDTVRIQYREIGAGSTLASILTERPTESPLVSTLIESSMSLPRSDASEEASEPGAVRLSYKEAI